MIQYLKKIVLKNLSANPIFLNLHSFLFSNRSRKEVDKLLDRINSVSILSQKDKKKVNENELKLILNHAYKTTTYYNDLFNSNQIDISSLDDLKKIPLLTKSIIKYKGEELISSDYDVKNLGKRFTGGSTGQPMEFYCDKSGPLLDNAHHWYLYNLIGYKPREIIVGLYGRGIPEKLTKKNIFWAKTIGDNVFGDFVFSSFYLNDKTIIHYINKLINLKPTILRGYPSFLNTIANYFIENNISLDFKIKGIVLTAELCSELQKENIETGFKSKVYFEYGHKEISIFCHSTSESFEYLSAPLYSYVEVLNDDGTDTPIGEIGRIITTGFCNYGMPFIRYDTGDLGKISSRNGGVITFENIEGRSQDHLIDKNNNKINLIASIYGYKMQAFKRIKRWQIKQDVPGEIELLIIKDAQFSKNDEKEILNTVEIFKGFVVKFTYVNDIPKSKIGKHLAVIQNIK